MIKRLLVIGLLVFLFSGIKAQSFGNGWINYSQNYYKIKVAQNGVYRIDSATMAAAGIPVGALDPHFFQLFDNGVQQYIYVQGENHPFLNGSDFIEFYAQKNDGALDSLLYVNTPYIPNPYFSLINDTAVYFLTWNISTSNNRLLPETDVYFAGFPTPSPYFFKDEVQEYHNQYFDGETGAGGGTDVRYTRAEGWFGVDGNGDPLYFGGINIDPVNTYNVYTAGPNALITTVIVGESQDASAASLHQNDHHITIEYQGNSGQFLAMSPPSGINFFGYQPQRILNYNLSPSLLSHSGPNPVTNFRFTSDMGGGIYPGINDNRTAISYIEVKYPHTLDLEGNSNFTMYVPNAPSGQAKSHLQISNFTATGTVHIYDLSNAKRITVVANGSGNFEALIPNSLSGNEKKCFITSDGNITNVTSLLPVTPTAQFTNFAVAPVDSAYIIVTHKSLMTSADAYRLYRSSIAGGSHNVIIADVDELYDQFAYGIVKSPIAIRGFCDLMIHTNVAYPPSNLFLLGKSLRHYYTRQLDIWYAGCLVPTFGNPGSDNLFTSGLIPSTIAPAIPTGRLAATSNNQVTDYLTKVEQFETLDTGEWKKQVLHFGGGSNSAEQNSFKYYLNRFKDTIQNIKFGGNVKSFFKTSSAPIQINTSDTLRDLINNGVALMTFFGHASGTSFDQSLDNINAYNPIQGHYPFLIANSCYAGDIHEGIGSSSSEIFVLTPQKGMIGYLGSVSLGVSSYLANYSVEFYAQLSRKNYGKSVGYLIQKTIAAPTFTPLDSNTCLEMTLHGDPAVKINPGDKPDYRITGNDVTFDVLSVPGYVIVNVVRTNIGMVKDTVSITELIRTFPDGTTIPISLVNREPYYKDTIKFKLKIDTANLIGSGLNKFYVTLDRNNTVDESNENNNATGEVDLLITGGDISPVYPYEFAIVPTDTVTLKAVTANLLATSKNYIFQIDTNDTFNSTSMAFHQMIITSVGGVVKWNPQAFIPHFADSTVYYWRVSPDSISPTSGYKWRESSFQYITTKKGWEQAHFFQYKNNTCQYVRFNRPQRAFDFFNNIKVIGCTTGGTGWDWYNAEYTVNSAAVYHQPWLVPSLTFAFFDPISGNPVPCTDSGNGFSNFGSFTNGGAGVHEVGFDYWQIHDSAFKIVNLINNIIPNGDYVLAFTPYNFTPFSPTQSLDTSVITAFQTQLGAIKIDTLHANRPYIFFGRKGGAVGLPNEIIGDSATQLIHSNNPINTNWTDGYIKSPIIGPAANSSTGWHSLHWRWKTLDGSTTKDSIVVKVIGINTSGVETVLAHFPKDSLDVLDLSTYVNATQFPYIRLEADMKDDSLHTPPQLKRWHVVYDPVPECAINPAVSGVHFISSENVQEGDNIVVQIPIQNIGSITFPAADSNLLVSAWVVDANGITHHFPDKLKKKYFTPNSVILDTITINTFDSIRFRGNNSLWVEANPINKPHSQLEQYHFNNIIRIPFRVSGDRTNPLLDVTFDGVHILNADIVSAKPNILMRLKDENQFLALNDTNDFKVFLQSPSSSTAKRIWFGPTMSFVPAVLPNNSCKINYTPVFPLDGTYQLIVQAKDVSSNLSGVDYKISFEIINKATITEVMNYPNPFSTATHFVFTLTGSQLPSNFKIQIMTITGKVVREIFEQELGFIHVGRNITDYAWDGRDEFGDRLANGVYLYRVITKLNGEDIERRETEADQYFKKGWGKMYLMR